jgi:hypothetical protein
MCWWWYKGGGLISLGLYKENNKLWDGKKCIYSTYSPSSTHLWLHCSNFFNPSKKNSFGCVGNRKSQILISTLMLKGNIKFTDNVVSLPVTQFCTQSVELWLGNENGFVSWLTTLLIPECYSPWHLKQLMWKYLSCTLNTSPEHFFLQFWQNVLPATHRK